MTRWQRLFRKLEKGKRKRPLKVQVNVMMPPATSIQNPMRPAVRTFANGHYFQTISENETSTFQIFSRPLKFS